MKYEEVDILDLYIKKEVSLSDVVYDLLLGSITYVVSWEMVRMFHLFVEGIVSKTEIDFKFGDILVIVLLLVVLRVFSVGVSK